MDLMRSLVTVIAGSLWLTPHEHSSRPAAATQTTATASPCLVCHNPPFFCAWGLPQKMLACTSQLLRLGCPREKALIFLD